MEEGKMPETASYWDRVLQFWEWAGTEEATPYLEMTLFVLTFVALWISMDAGCTLCVFVLLLISMFFCCRFRFMFFTLWACIGVLWIHGWRFGGGKGLSVQWN